jgi:hypothetical protein
MRFVGGGGEERSNLHSLLGNLELARAYHTWSAHGSKATGSLTPQLETLNPKP